MKGLIILDFSRTLYNKDNERLHHGAVEFLEKYGKSYKLALISKRDDDDRAEHLRKLGIDHHFELAIIRDKKGLDEFREAMEKTGFTAEKTWVIGDKVKTEIAVGKQLGCRTIWFRHGKYSDVRPGHEGEMPDHEVSSWKEAEGIIPL